jgi:hypothetical protein
MRRRLPAESRSQALSHRGRRLSPNWARVKVRAKCVWPSGFVCFETQRMPLTPTSTFYTGSVQVLGVTHYSQVDMLAVRDTSLRGVVQPRQHWGSFEIPGTGMQAHAALPGEESDPAGQASHTPEVGRCVSIWLLRPKCPFQGCLFALRAVCRGCQVRA